MTSSSMSNRRLSDVGVAFGQHIAANIGLKLPASQERIVEQTRLIYLKYLFTKLRRNSLPLRDLNISSTRASKPICQLIVPPTINTTNVSGSNNARIRRSYADTLHPNSAPILTQTQENLLTTGMLSRRGTVYCDNDVNFAQASEIINSWKFSPRASICLSKLTLDELGSVTKDTNNNNTESPTWKQIEQRNPPQRRHAMDSSINNQIYGLIVSIIHEMRVMKPEIFQDSIYKTIGIDKFSSLQSLIDVQTNVCQEMIRSDISWSRIAAMYSLVGSIALDCVRLGLSEYVGPLMEEFINFIERDVAAWISQQGGFESFLYNHRAKRSLFNANGPDAIVAFLIVTLLLWFLLFIFK